MTANTNTQPEALRLADGNDECAKAWLESSDAHKFRRDTAAELRRRHAECEALRKQLADATTPDMFLDASDPELYGNDVQELAYEYDNGSVFKVECAKRLPSFSVRVTGPDGEHEYIDAARAAIKEQSNDH